ncbi:hypothetical protein Glove_63g18 [Diversispora epigaea]|uniref:Uncharacterized protein n=1 Tax=Diversispora epigaea TaxID=1348612 RepID=A0A397JC94_9GLOM|nr:hypothetical protein Glove_63g18 [Diversispora epigaea]
MSLFHIDYKIITDKLEDKLPKSLVKRLYDRLLSLKHNPITLNQISEKHNRIETYLYHTLEIYEQGKAHNNTIDKGSQNTDVLTYSKVNISSHTENEQSSKSSTHIDHSRVSTRGAKLYLEKLRQELSSKINNENILYLENEREKLTNENFYNTANEQDKKIIDLTSSINRYKEDMQSLKKVNKLVNKCQQLKDVVLAKNQKIILLNNKVISYCPCGWSDGSIEPEMYCSTYKQNL